MVAKGTEENKRKSSRFIAVLYTQKTATQYQATNRRTTVRAQGSTQKYTIIVLYISAFSTLSHEQQQQLRYYIIIVDWAAYHRRFPTHRESVLRCIYNIQYSSIQYHRRVCTVRSNTALRRFFYGRRLFFCYLLLTVVVLSNIARR